MGEDEDGKEAGVQQSSIGIEMSALVTRRVPKPNKPDFWKELNWNLQYKDYDVDITLNPETIELVEIQDITE